MQAQLEYLIAVSLLFVSGRRVSETFKVRGISEGHAKVMGYAKMKDKYSCDTIDDRTVICLGLCEPA